MRPSNARLTSVGLVVALVVSSFLLSGAVSSLSGAIAVGPGRRFLDLLPGGNVTAVSTMGRILVRTSMNGGGLLSSVPLSGVNVTIRGASSPIAIVAFPFHTNSSGAFELPLDPGAYYIAITDPRFRISTSVSIFPRETTEADVSVTKELHQATFYEVVDQDSSGWLAPWNTMTVVTDSSLRQVNKTVPLFLDAVAQVFTYHWVNGGVKSVVLLTVPLHPEETQVTVLGVDQRNSAIWLTLRSRGFVDISGNQNFELATYGSGLRVYTYAA